MSDFKKGDKVLIAATVLQDGTDSDGDVVIDAGGSDGYGYATPSNCTLIKPDEFKVGDPVETSGGCQTTIEEITTGYRLKDGSNKFAGLWTRDEITKLPPEPTYRVERNKDRLELWDDKGLRSDVPMANPELLLQAVATWPRVWGIDADKLQKLADEPREIGRYGLSNHVVCIATRFAKGWQAVCRGRIQTEHLAQAMFDIDGPYLTEEQ